jgi:putative addiction module component (TIGR02574 family)
VISGVGRGQTKPKMLLLNKKYRRWYMLSDIQEIEKKALKLSPHERAILAEHLINSLDDKEDAEAEQLWIKEAERRYREYKEGKVKAKPAGQVFKEAFSKLS